MSIALKISFFCFVVGILTLFFTDHIWPIAIPFLAVAILIPLIKFIWGVAGWASNKVEGWK